MATSGSKSVTVTGNHTLRFEWSLSSQDIENNRSAIYWELYVDTDAYGKISLGGSQAWSVTVDGQTKSGADSGGFGNNQNKLLGSGTFYVYHESDGSKTFQYSFEKLFGFTWGGTYRGTYSGSGNATLPVIPRKSTLSVSNGTLGTQMSLSADRKASSFTHTLTWSASGRTGTIASNSSATSWNFTPELSLAELIPNTTSLSISFTLTTLNSGSSIGSDTKTVTLTLPANVIPQGDMTVEDTTNNFIELGKYLQRQSKLKIKVTAVGAYESTITAISVVADGNTYNATGTASVNREYEFITPELTGEGSSTITATIRDSRGRTNTIRKTIDIQSYNAPRITQLDVHRCNADGTENQSGLYAKVTYSFEVSSVSSGTVTLKYKKSQESSWNTVSLPSGQSATGATKVFPADDGSPYDIELVISDDFGTASRRTALSTGFTLVHYPASGRGMTIGAVATRNGFNVHMMSRFNSGFSYKPKVMNSVDCDTVLESGVYFIGNYATNRPPSNKVGWLDVMSINDGYYCVQQYITYDFQIWIRYRENEQWKPWFNTMTYIEM